MATRTPANPNFTRDAIPKVKVGTKRQRADGTTEIYLEAPVRDSLTITRDEWLAAIGAAEVVTNDPNAKTMVELCDLLNLSHRHVARKLRRLEAEGKVIRTTKRLIRTSGGAYTAPAFILKT